jgi:hypothetical protein
MSDPVDAEAAEAAAAAAEANLREHIKGTRLGGDQLED